MGGRLIQLLLALSLLLNAFVLAGFVYRSWVAPPVEQRALPPGARPGGPLEAMAEELGLSADQRKALHDVFEKNQADRRRRVQDIQHIREQTGAEFKKDQVDMARVDAQIDEISKMRAEQQKETFRAILALEPQLTPQQRTKLHEILADRYINPPRWWGGPRRPGEAGRPPR